jgi:tetratricopeptide (TPR) repeat protein
VVTQNTSSLWALLCEELEARRAKESAAEHSEAARKFEETAKQIFQKSPGRLRDALEIAGDIHQATNSEADARRCFEEALGVESAPAPQRARLATKLAIIAEGRNDVNNARRFYALAVAAHEETRDRSELPTLLNNLGGMHRAAGDFSSAEKAYQRALVEAVSVYGADNPEVALIANNLGVAYTDHGNLVKAEDSHLRALQIREQTFGSNHPDVGQSLANLAAVYHAKKLYLKAERFYLSALETLSQFYGTDNPQVARIRENYERLPQVHSRRLSKTMRL